MWCAAPTCRQRDRARDDFHARGSHLGRLALVLGMKFLSDLKARLPRLFPTLIALVAVGGAGSYAAYQHFADDCCELGAACCRPGAACCLRHHAANK